MASPSDGESLPSAQELQAYEKAFPGMAKELLAMAKEDQKHLHEMERAETSLSRRGQLFGLVIALSFLLAATVLIYSHHDTAGTVIGSTDLVALVAVFVIGRRAGSDSRDQSLDRLIRQISKEPQNRRKSVGRRSSTSTTERRAVSTQAVEPSTEPQGTRTADKPQSNKGDEQDADTSNEARPESLKPEPNEPLSSPEEGSPVDTTLETMKPPAELSEEDRQLWQRFSKEMGLGQETDE